MKQNSAENYDVVIVGAGIIGLTLANLLAAHRLQIAIIEAQKPSLSWNSGKQDMRVSAINAFSQTIFDKIDVWSLIEKMRINPYQKMHVWDAMNQAEIHFNCTEIGSANLGYIIENNVIQLALLQRAESHENIHLIYSAPRELSRTQDAIYLSLENQQNLQAKLLIGADGAQSWVRKNAHIESRSSTYQQTAIVTTVRTEKSHQNTAWQRFLPDSILAFLPLENPQTCSIVWSVNDDRIDSLISLNEIEFNQALTEAFEKKLGITEIIDQRRSFPLSMQHAKQYVQARIALVGDAVRLIHPLAGQGVNLGLLDVATLCESIEIALEKKQNIGNILTLRRYERARKADNIAMIAAMEGFKKLFNNTHPLLSKIRSFGLQTTHKSPWIKNMFIRKALG